MLDGVVSLYDLSKDLGEQTDLAQDKPELVKKAVAFMDEAHVSDPIWKVRGKRN